MEKKYSLLYVDDEESNLRIFRTSFKRYYKVHIAASGQEGLKILSENKIDLILTDQKMPEMTGVEFLKEAIKDYPDLIRIIVTGFSDTESIVEAINECRLYQYVTKPWKNEEMRFLIDKALDAYQTKMDKMKLMDQLKEANEELERKVIERTKKIRNSINYAKRIQTAILPTQATIEKYLPESFIYFRPKDIISGDFYWIGEVDNKIIFGAFDCTGHGVPGAFMTLIGTDLMNLITLVKGKTDPAEILTELHKEVVSQLKQDENKNQDGMDVAICTIDRAAKTLEFAGAKNSLISVQNGQLEEHKGDKFPIGGTQYQENREFQKKTFQLDGMGSFYMFSDGYIDQFGGPEGKKFMRKKLKDLLSRVCDMPMDQQKELLSNAMMNWIKEGQQPQIDDMLVVGFEA